MTMQIQKILVAGVLILVGQAVYAEWDKPDHKAPTCVATPTEMAQRPDLIAYAETMKDRSGQVGLDAFVGTWHFSMVIASSTISFRYNESGFFVQNEDDILKRVSLCLDSPDSEWLRISTHNPSCPENQNFYVQPAGVGKMRLMAFTTQRAPGGKVTFGKKSNEPMPEGSPKPPLPCQMPKDGGQPLSEETP